MTFEETINDSIEHYEEKMKEFLIEKGHLDTRVAEAKTKLTDLGFEIDEEQRDSIIEKLNEQWDKFEESYAEMETAFEEITDEVDNFDTDDDFDDDMGLDEDDTTSVESESETKPSEPLITNN